MTVIDRNRRDGVVLPFTATSEDKIEQFAAAIEALYSSPVVVNTYEEGGKWYAVVVEGASYIGDPFEAPHIESAYFLLRDYDLAEKKDAATIDHICEGREEYQPALKELKRRGRRVAQVESQLSSVISRLDKIESALAKEATT